MMDAEVWLRAWGIDDPRNLDVAAWWAERRSWRDPRWAQIPIGVKPDGQIQNIDFRAPNQGGNGFHSMVIGTAGTGKSTVFLSMVYAIALTHSPEAFNVVVADANQHSIVEDVRDLPHVVAAASGLCDPNGSGRAERLAKAIGAELERRYGLCASAGARDANEYEELRLAGRDLEPIPILLVMIENYTELVAQYPQWMDAIITIGEMGRGAKVFFMLGGQRLDSLQLHTKVQDHVGFTIALRIERRDDSRAVMGSDAASRLPNVPGSALLNSGPQEPEPFRSFNVSTPLPPSQTPQAPQDASVSKLTIKDALRELITASNSRAPLASWPNLDANP